MAEKMVFFPDPVKGFREEIVEYTYYGGFAVSQKQKCIRSIHESVERKYPEMGGRILEISTKSLTEEGRQLSAFNLKFFHKGIGEYRSLENVYQASKVFVEGGPYTDLLHVHPRDAKRDERLKTSGSMVCYRLGSDIWPLEPKTMFYDYLYISALKEDMELARKLLDYECFTDVEYNFRKSLNCQARAAAIFVSLSRKGLLEEKTASVEAFQSVYEGMKEEQISLF